MITHKIDGYIKLHAFNLYDLCNSNTENRILTYLISKVKKGFILEFKYEPLAKKFGVSTKTIQTLIRKLKQADFIYGTKGIYKVNPYYITYYRATDEGIAEAQREWDERGEQQ